MFDQNESILMFPLKQFQYVQSPRGLCLRQTEHTVAGSPERALPPIPHTSFTRAVTKKLLPSGYAAYYFLPSPTHGHLHASPTPLLSTPKMRRMSLYELVTCPFFSQLDTLLRYAGIGRLKSAIEHRLLQLISLIWVTHLVSI